MLAGMGTIGGPLLIWPASRLAGRFLFGARPGDPATLVIATAVLCSGSGGQCDPGAARCRRRPYGGAAV
jgi:hypothetical protein